MEISSPARLSLKNRQMEVVADLSETTVPIEDIGVLILDHPAIIHTQALLRACFENNTAVIFCCARHLPGGLLLPIEGNTLHGKTVAVQVRMGLPLRKRLWRDIVRAKIICQSTVLEAAGKDAGPLQDFTKRVRSGDPENIEAQAARFYWQRLFGDDFRRDRDEEGINALLNYGYSVIRAASARAIVSTGLHPSIGLHHRNQYNSFTLADDIMEPLRPFVDLKVHSLSMEGSPMEINKESKRAILGVLSGTCDLNGQRPLLLSGLTNYAVSLKKAISRETNSLEIPLL